MRDIIARAVLLGPVHRVPVRGLALPGVDSFATPLGDIEMDQAAIIALADLPQVVVNRAAHAPEHSLEVQLPFLQQALTDFKLVPPAVGRARNPDCGQFRPVALFALPRGAGAGPGHRAAHPAP